MRLEAYDRARARIATEGFTPEIQTRIAHFLAATKAVNLPFLTAATLGPAQGLAWQALASQLFREHEALALLTRITAWSPDPRVWAAATALALPLWREAARLGLALAPHGRDAIGLDALAFGHALLAGVRLAPIVPPGALAADPFAVALLRIEQENGRLLQTQIRLLKDGYVDVPLSARESAVAAEAAIVGEAFDAFLASIAGDGAP